MWLKAFVKGVDNNIDMKKVLCKNGKEFNAVILMAGNGNRVKNKQCNIPKPLIEIEGKPMFYYAAKSIRNHLPNCRLVFVTLKMHEEQYNICERIKHYFPNASIFIMDKVLNGPVYSAMEATKIITDNNPVLFCDCDLAFKVNDFEKKINEFLEKAHDGMLLSFYSNSLEYSYIDCDGNDICKQIVEKKVISNRAVCGCYFFNNVYTVKKYAQKVIESYDRECYMSDIIAKMIADNKKICVCMVDEHLSFGTTKEIERLNQKNQVI